MSTCLKKQIKGETPADLPVFNTIKFIFDGDSPSGKYYMTLNIEGSYQIIALGGTKIYDSTGNTELTSPVSTSWNQTFTFTHQQGDGVLITKKYGLIWLVSPYDKLDVHLNILELASCIKLTRFKPTIQNKNNLNITGEITDFAAKQVLYGRTSGELVFGRYTGITLNGNILQNEVTVRYGSSMVDPTSEETTQGYQIA